jgi:GNAT superfamily N-acetyltransferase
MKPTASVLEEADASWSTARSPSDAHDWRWTRLVVDSHDDFAVLDGSNAPVALWSSHASKPLELPGGEAYRLDFLEVAPPLRGKEIGVFTLGLIAIRALECGATRLVLGSIPQAARFYDSVGGRQHKIRGWKVARGLLPYEFPHDALTRLREAIDELET